MTNVGNSEDIMNICYLLSKSGHQAGQEYLTNKFSEDAIGDRTKDVHHKNPSLTAFLTILQGLSSFQRKSNKAACLKLVTVTPPTESDTFEQQLSEIMTMNDLAYYICLSALMSCDRKELKNTVLKATNFTLLTGSLSETKLIIEQFLNGDYNAF